MKLRLDFFKSIGGKVAKGDVVIDSDGNRVAIKSSALLNSYNLANHSDDKCFIESFAPRKNTGEQPCGDDMPVLAEVDGIDGFDAPHVVFASQWKWRGDGNLTAWKYDLEALIKMQAEHDAEKDESVKSVYTQAMKDAGELPSVGMKCVLVNCNCDHQGVVMFISDNYTIISYEGGVGQFREQHFHTENITFKPIDTRTPEEKQVARVVKHMNMVTFETDEAMVKSMQQAGLLAEIK